MTLPVWFVAILASVFAGQLIAGIAWAIRTDKATALDRADQKASALAVTTRLERIERLFERHDPMAIRAELDQHAARHSAVEVRLSAMEAIESRQAALIRRLARRLDKANIPNVEPSESDG